MCCGVCSIMDVCRMGIVSITCITSIISQLVSLLVTTVCELQSTGQEVFTYASRCYIMPPSMCRLSLGELIQQHTDKKTHQHSIQTQPAFVKAWMWRETYRKLLSDTGRVTTGYVLYPITSLIYNINKQLFVKRHWSHVTTLHTKVLCEINLIDSFIPMASSSSGHRLVFLLWFGAAPAAATTSPAGRSAWWPPSPWWSRGN